MIEAQKETVGLAKGTRGQLKGKKSSGGLPLNPPESDKPTLASVGIDKNLANRARKMACQKLRASLPVG